MQEQDVSGPVQNNGVIASRGFGGRWEFHGLQVFRFTRDNPSFLLPVPGKPLSLFCERHLNILLLCTGGACVGMVHDATSGLPILHLKKRWKPTLCSMCTAVKSDIPHFWVSWQCAKGEGNKVRRGISCFSLKRGLWERSAGGTSNLDLGSKRGPRS